MEMKKRVLVVALICVSVAIALLLVFFPVS